MLLQAMADMGGDWKNWTLVVVGGGDPDYVTSLKSMADGVSTKLPKIQWIGPVWGAARWPYLQGADLFCLPTHSENFGLAVLEALHAGTPVLTTDQTPWVDHAGLDGLFIARPEIQGIQQTLALARKRMSENWSPVDRQNLAAWAEKRFAWEYLSSAYVIAYSRL